MKRFFLGVMVCISSVVAVPACSSSDTPVDDTNVVNVDVGGAAGDAFTPKEITVKIGQTVRWTWKGGEHNVVSGPDGVCPDPNDPTTTAKASDGILRSGAPQSGGTFDWKADKVEVVNYHCEPHCSLGMVGKITVTQ